MLSGFGSFEGLANLIQNLFAIRKMMKGPLLDTRRGIIKAFRIQPKIRIGDSYEVSVVYEGSVKAGYFSLMIQDAVGIKQWFTDNNSVGRKILDSGESVQTGTLNFSNGLYEST
jgi:hypothetical protein